MIEYYQKIFSEMNQAMRDDPMLNSMVSSELFEQIMETWKINLEKKGIVKKNAFVTSKGFYGAFRDRLDHFSALGRHPNSAFKPIRVDDTPFTLNPKPSKHTSHAGADFFELPYPTHTQSEYLFGRDSVLASKLDLSQSRLLLIRHRKRPAGIKQRKRTFGK